MDVMKNDFRLNAVRLGALAEELRSEYANSNPFAHRSLHLSGS